MQSGSTFRIQLDGERALHAQAWGDRADPPVVFSHGGGQTKFAWGQTASVVAQSGYYTTTYDHRGHGQSDWTSAYRFEDFAEDLYRVTQTLDQKPVLVGASLGGIASLIAQTRHRCAAAVVLVDITPRVAPQGVDRILTFMGAHPNGFASLEEAAEHVAAYLPHRPRPSDLSGLRKNLRETQDGRLVWHWDPRLLDAMVAGVAGAQERMDALLDASQLDVPTLLVRGRQSDVVTEAEVQDFLSQAPHAEYLDVFNAAHTVAGDRNDVFTDSVVDFLRRHFPNSRPGPNAERSTT